MRKRLRKKKHVGEFQELGFEVRYVIRSGLSVQERNKIIEGLWETVEACGLFFGGGGGGNEQEGYVAVLEGRGSATDEHRRIVSEYLSNHPNVTEVHVEPLSDAYYGQEEDNLLS